MLGGVDEGDLLEPNEGGGVAEVKEEIVLEGEEERQKRCSGAVVGCVVVVFFDFVGCVFVVGCVVVFVVGCVVIVFVVGCVVIVFVVCCAVVVVVVTIVFFVVAMLMKVAFVVVVYIRSCIVCNARGFNVVLLDKISNTFIITFKIPIRTTFPGINNFIIIFVFNF